MVLSLPLGLLETGGVAQLGERLLCKQEVIGSNPFTSTTGVWRSLTDTVRGNPGGGVV